MLIGSQAASLARLCKALGDPQRLRIVALGRTGEVSVGELTEILGLSQPRVSQHLKYLCESGLLERFRDGKRVFYRLPATRSATLRRLLALIPESDPAFESDQVRLRELRGLSLKSADADDPARRAIGRALIELTVAAPLGELLDVGCGTGRLLKLLASRANRAVGIDTDAAARNVARAELYLAGIANCSVRQGDMYRLDFDDASFDTIILSDVLATADRPLQALAEAQRVMRPSGRLLVLHRLAADDARSAAADIAAWGAACGLRTAAPRALPARDPQWLLSVLTSADYGVAAA